MISNILNFINPIALYSTAAPATTGAEEVPAGCAGNSGMILVIYILIFAAMYFFMIRPNSKKKKQEEELKKNINVGDDITTIGGICGKVVAVRDEDEEIIIETGADRVKLRFKKWCIYSNNTAIAAQEEEKKRQAEEKARLKAEKKAGKNKDKE
ncbi:MAG: preprotein translocase subunit YajC [Ruminococcus sp.]|nr:preprotein translocase subunit YajC [Ruminococcus sp.]